MVSGWMNEYGAGGTDPLLHDTWAVLWVHDGDIYECPWGHARDVWYSVSAYPTLELDGTDAGWPYNPQWKNAFLARQAIPTDVTIELFGDQVSGATFDITLEVCVEASGSSKTMSIYIVQVLDNWPLSPSWYRNCVMQAADEPHGTEPVVTLAPGECETIIRTMTFGPDSWAHQSDIKIIAFAQEDNPSPPAEVYQAAIMTWPFPSSAALVVSLPDGVPEYIPPGEPADITVQIEDRGETYVPESGLLHYRYDGGTYLTDTLTPLGGDLYKATLPPPECDSVPEFYISAEGDEGTTIYSPEDAPTSVYTTSVGNVNMILEDNFDLELGWTVDNTLLTGGQWECDVPIDEPDETRHPPRSDYDGSSGKCYLTQNLAGNSDVDLGPGYLISPTFDLSNTTDPILRFARWWWNDDEDADPMIVEISNDDGGTWIPVLTITNVPPEWVREVIYVASAIDPEPLTSLMKVRFSVADVPNDSKDEGGIDAIEIFDVTCAECQAGDIDCNGELNEVDIVLFVNVLLGTETTQEYVDRSDLYEDGETDGKDVQSFVEAFLS